MKTIQGKDFNYEDILLYNVVSDQIIMIINDPEQMKIFNYTGRTEDAPISRMPYTKDAEYEIVTKMKKIKSYMKLDNCIEVTYKDKVKSKFDLSNEEVIKNILDAQNKVTKDVISASWAALPAEQKVEKKKSASSKWKKGIVGALAAIALFTTAFLNKDKIESALENRNNRDDSNQSKTEAVIEMQNNKEEQYYIETASFDFTGLGKKLYQETLDKENLVLKYQQVVNINWDEDLATKVIEFMNGKYPIELLSASDPDAFQRATEIQQAWSLLITSNINPETTPENMINFEDYYLRQEERVIIHNAMAIARNAMNETIGEPMNGYIIEEGDSASINKFSREFIGAVDQLLNYEYDTLTDPVFNQMSSGTRWTVTSTFQQVNNVIPQWSYITRELNGVETNIYYRSFRDFATNDFYYAIPGENGTVNYRCDSLNKTLNEYDMFAISGTPMLEEERNVNVEVNPNLHQTGIQVNVDNAFNEAAEDVYALRDIAKNLSRGVTK